MKHQTVDKVLERRPDVEKVIEELHFFAET